MQLIFPTSSSFPAMICSFHKCMKLCLKKILRAVHGKTAVTANLLNCVKWTFSFFATSRIYRYCIFSTIFCINHCGPRIIIKYVIFLMLHAANSRPNAILTILQILQSCHARQHSQHLVREQTKSTKKLDLLSYNSIHRMPNYPIKNYRGLSPNYRRKRWAYVHFIRGAANHPIFLHYEACKCAYLYKYSKWGIYE